MSVDIIIEAGDWPEWVEEETEKVSVLLFSHFGFSDEDVEFSALFTDNEKMRALNAEFRDKDKATNVLSWPSNEAKRALGEHPEKLQFSPSPFANSLGDLAFGFETCTVEAQEVGLSAHISHLLIHGFLHLIGYDHIFDEDAEVMEALEISLLSSLNIDNPYELQK